MNDGPWQTVLGRPGFALSGDAGFQKIAASFAGVLLNRERYQALKDASFRVAEQMGDVGQPQLPVSEMLARPAACASVQEVAEALPSSSSRR